VTTKEQRQGSGPLWNCSLNEKSGFDLCFNSYQYILKLVSKERKWNKIRACNLKSNSKNDIYLQLSPTLDILIHDRKKHFFPTNFQWMVKIRIDFQSYNTPRLSVESIYRTISTVNLTKLSDMCNGKGLYWRHIQWNFSNIYLKKT
jgi:hypothetical protein